MGSKKTPCSTVSYLKSSWTPLNNVETNAQVFQERRALLGKWYDMWSDAQRVIILEDLIGKLSLSHLEAIRVLVDRRLPIKCHDFTRLLPRVLTLHILSYLDPRSLCRCAQVCWSWKYVAELDQLWMPKCMRFGWLPAPTPSTHEPDAWKRLYAKRIKELNLTRPKRPSSVKTCDSGTGRKSTRPQSSWCRPRSPSPDRRPRTRPSSATDAVVEKNQKNKVPPWRDSDPHPTDTLRMNYLDNDMLASSKHYMAIKTKLKAAATAINATTKLMAKHSDHISDKALALPSSGGGDVASSLTVTPLRRVKPKSVINATGSGDAQATEIASGDDHLFSSRISLPASPAANTEDKLSASALGGATLDASSISSQKLLELMRQFAVASMELAPAAGKDSDIPLSGRQMAPLLSLPAAGVGKRHSRQISNAIDHRESSRLSSTLVPVDV
ncbi:PREDICTED: uncharacterized protein LOC106810032 isoform X2 [Priapulus caudatus]|uniref:Uncharacterized protein LOC106810032 isoform X2 n=1 Tax=Priapulus caudatus TaxID=37621 RepID=A0ABM1E9A6_PRICU|nr:PREDICTED: uncharacterized protein LOC106810032 isoform X2 [Priapulus caudatus]